jgi:diguanylate cyclase (GGDEF)-like protein
MILLKQNTSKLGAIPLWMRILTLLIFFIPFFFDQPSGGTTEFIWFVYIIPAFIFSYYWGLKGGVFTAFLSMMTQIGWELVSCNLDDENFNNGNLLVIIVRSLISFGIAFGIGLLASRLKHNQQIIEKINLELRGKNKQLDHLSNMDELTGLWNRRGLLKAVHDLTLQKNQEQTNFNVLFIDLDKFKPINDTYGRQVGNILLQDVAKRLKECVPEKAIISRVGGDEFTIILQNTTEAHSVLVAEKIRTDLSKVFIIQRKEIFITPSIGISLSSSNGSEVEQLLQNADIAVSFVKREGKNGFLIFDQSMKEFTEKRIHLENDLHKAIEQEELILYYQPQFDVKAEQIVSFEALIRWSSNGKMISPGEFIPIAEETGLIIPIGNWVIESACRQIKSWIEAGYPAIPISVNVSSHQFQHPDFIQNIQIVFKKTQIDPTMLKLEITESDILGNEKSIIMKLKNLKQLGVSISIDDFGSGYSSLAYLKNFPIDEIKMDKLFIDEIGDNFKDRLLVQTIIQLGQSLDTQIVAEGVETIEQLSFLKEAGCNVIQGFLIGKPMPVINIEKIFQNGLGVTVG